METTEKRRSFFFTPPELEVLMTSFAEHEHIFKKKSNTAAASKERKLAWQKIADRVNA